MQYNYDADGVIVMYTLDSFEAGSKSNSAASDWNIHSYHLILVCGGRPNGRWLIREALQDTFSLHELTFRSYFLSKYSTFPADQL